MPTAAQQPDPEPEQMSFLNRAQKILKGGPAEKLGQYCVGQQKLK